MYSHSLTDFVDMPDISSILSRMTFILLCFVHTTQGFHLSASDLCYSVVEKWFYISFCHFVREKSSHLFRSH